MDFTTPIFLFLFLPPVLCLYWAGGPRLRLPFLLVASLLFYAWWEGMYLPVLGFSILVNHLFSLAIDRRDDSPAKLRLLFAGIAANLMLLLSFKYPVPLSLLAARLPPGLVPPQPLHQPLGLSFFTFQAISYLIEVYHGSHRAARNPFRLSLFLSLFPKMGAGPIVRYQDVEEALDRPRISLDDCAYGAKRFIFGLGKKMLIADTLARSADPIFALGGEQLTAPLAWIAIVCYTLQLYFDFSGYSDMAIGLGRMLGFRFPENFDYPYRSRSLTEFWRRWHLSLSSWFRDYLYTPLVYSLITERLRQKIARGEYRTNYRSLSCIVFVFVLCGWWHGSSLNFLIWGLLHGVLLALEGWKLGKLLKKAPAPVAHGYTMAAVMLCWIFFRTATPQAALTFLAALAGLGPGTGVYDYRLYLNNQLYLVLALALAGAVPLAGWIREKLEGALAEPVRRWSMPAVETACVTLVLLVSLCSAAGSTYKPFIYSRF